MGLTERRSSKRFVDSFEVSEEVHRTKGGKEAKKYLRMRSGVHISNRFSSSESNKESQSRTRRTELPVTRKPKRLRKPRATLTPKTTVLGDISNGKR